jgi:hypothetical protein
MLPMLLILTLQVRHCHSHRLYKQYPTVHRSLSDSSRARVHSAPMRVVLAKTMIAVRWSDLLATFEAGGRYECRDHTQHVKPYKDIRFYFICLENGKHEVEASRTHVVYLVIVEQY